MKNNLQDRISYQGDLKKLLEKVSADFGLGTYRSHKVNTIGYEDFNVLFEASSGKYFAKIFSKERNLKDCQRITEVIEKVISCGVNHPMLFSHQDGYLYQYKHEDGETCLIVMEYVEGKTFYDLKREPSGEEIEQVIGLAAKINSIDCKPDHIYDSWAVPNITREYRLVEKYLSESDMALLVPLIEKAEEFDFLSLPHAFVHGDLIKTNLMLDTSGEIFVIDFSVANWYPRVQELAVLLVSTFFHDATLKSCKKTIEKVIDKYQKCIKLSDLELGILPFYVQLAHAMHVIGSTKEKFLKGDESEENDYWLSLGRKGLSFMDKY